MRWTNMILSRLWLSCWMKFGPMKIGGTCYANAIQTGKDSYGSVSWHT